MRSTWWCLSLVMGCGLSHERLDCDDDPTVFEAAALSGPHELSIAEVRVLEGVYERGPDPNVLVRLTLAQEYLMAVDAAGDVALAQGVGYEDYRRVAGVGYCTGDESTLIDPPPPWFERSHFRLTSPELTGEPLRRSDPTLASVESLEGPSLATRDEDGGLSFHARYRVRRAGCTDSCDAVIELTYHLRPVDE